MVDIGWGLALVCVLGCGRTNNTAKDASVTTSDGAGVGGAGGGTVLGGTGGSDATFDAPSRSDGSTTAVGDADTPPALDTSAKPTDGGTLGARPTGETYGGGCPSSASTGPCDASTAPNQCTYGDATRSECRSVLFCSGSQWQVLPASCSAPSPPSACPAAPPANYGTCGAPAVCRFDDGTDCECAERASAPGTFVWSCSFATVFAGRPDCLATPPNAGSTCNPAVTTSPCDYRCNAGDATTISAVCGSNGLWQWWPVSCLM